MVAAAQVLASDFKQCLCDACVTSQYEVMDSEVKVIMRTQKLEYLKNTNPNTANTFCLSLAQEKGC